MKNLNGKSLEQVILELHKKYKNVPSPLKENKSFVETPIIPQQKSGNMDTRANLLGNFKPTPKSW